MSSVKFTYTFSFDELAKNSSIVFIDNEFIDVKFQWTIEKDIIIFNVCCNSHTEMQTKLKHEEIVYDFEPMITTSIKIEHLLEVSLYNIFNEYSTHYFCVCNPDEGQQVLKNDVPLNLWIRRDIVESDDAIFSVNLSSSSIEFRKRSKMTIQKFNPSRNIMEIPEVIDLLLTLVSAYGAPKQTDIYTICNQKILGNGSFVYHVDIFDKIRKIIGSCSPDDIEKIKAWIESVNFSS